MPGNKKIPGNKKFCSTIYAFWYPIGNYLFKIERFLLVVRLSPNKPNRRFALGLLVLELDKDCLSKFNLQLIITPRSFSFLMYV